MNGLKILEPLSGISETILAMINAELGRFFKTDYLDNFFKDSYFEEIRSAELERRNLRDQHAASDTSEKAKRKRINKNITAWEHKKRYRIKRVRDFQRLKFIEEFSNLIPIDKLRRILIDELDFPLISIPDDALFKLDLLLHSEIKKTFSNQETYILKMKFLCKRQRNRGENWSSILKAL